MYTVKALKDVYAIKLAGNKKNPATKMKSLKVITDKTKGDRLSNKYVRKRVKIYKLQCGLETRI
jgi:hypothetical protein